VAVVSVGLAFCCGTLIGSVSGYYKGRLDNIVMRGIDIILSFPYILLAIVVVAYLGRACRTPCSPSPLPTCRGLRASCARACSRSARRTTSWPPRDRRPHLRIIFVTILPNCMGPLIVQTTLELRLRHPGRRGLELPRPGRPAADPEWGADIARSRALILRASWVMTFPGLAILGAVLGSTCWATGCGTRSTRG